MSCIYKGSVIETEQSRSAMGGTEQMRHRLISNVDPTLLDKVAIHFSRVRVVYSDVPNILYCHDRADDPENNILQDDGWKRFSMLVFVSHWQQNEYKKMFSIPDTKCVVIENAIEPGHNLKKDDDKIRLIYHTTPHRGLAILFPVFDALSNLPEFQNRLHLDVFSSFELYGWKQRDKPFEDFFNRIHSHPNATYHGAKSNSVVRDYLDRAHYFPYPCIWEETSCIALIEAIEHKVLAIHPKYGALPETGGKNTIQYEWFENPYEHAKTFYSVLGTVLEKDFQKQMSINSRPEHDISTYTRKWNRLLRGLTTHVR